MRLGKSHPPSPDLVLWCSSAKCTKWPSAWPGPLPPPPDRHHPLSSDYLRCFLSLNITPALLCMPPFLSPPPPFPLPLPSLLSAPSPPPSTHSSPLPSSPILQDEVLSISLTKWPSVPMMPVYSVLDLPLN